MLFCPRCANLLLIDGASGGGLRWKCQTCPYTHTIQAKMRKKVTLETRKDDAVYGDSNFRAITEMARCPKCNATKAYFYEMQTRSADEPATIFYKCVACSHQWKEG